MTTCFHFYHMWVEIAGHWRLTPSVKTLLLKIRASKRPAVPVIQHYLQPLWMMLTGRNTICKLGFWGIHQFRVLYVRAEENFKSCLIWFSFSSYVWGPVMWGESLYVWVMESLDFPVRILSPILHISYKSSYSSPQLWRCTSKQSRHRLCPHEA